MRRPMKQTHNKNFNFFNELPEDIVIFILIKLSSTASSPSHLLNIISTCKRLNELGLHPMVLSKAGPKVFTIKPQNWSESSHNFLKLCVKAENVDAIYTLGMILFYCLKNRRSGLFLIAKAAKKLHAPALYSLAIIQFNGSGKSKQHKDLRAGVALSFRASLLGNVDALREYGHCLQDGYGVEQNVNEGRRLLLQANFREVMFVLHSLVTESPSRVGSCRWPLPPSLSDMEVPLISDYNVTLPEVHPANWFLREWFESGRGSLEDGLRLCTHIGCRRPETRPHEFRRCSVCGKANYCSRACQSLDWKLRHKMECLPVELRFNNNEVGNDIVGGLNENEVVVMAAM